VVVWRGRSDWPGMAVRPDLPREGRSAGLARRSDRPSPDFWAVLFLRS
jgi:hypothetical protein